MCACASHLMTQPVGSSGADVSVWLKEDDLGSHLLRCVLQLC